ncbi:MAG: hypothetical protein IPI30_18640 [Saprospiraceae bacterium]|nr:hypothetical protein [Candidatus Vicinibacter affinis]
MVNFKSSVPVDFITDTINCRNSIVDVKLKIQTPRARCNGPDRMVLFLRKANISQRFRLVCFAFVDKKKDVPVSIQFMSPWTRPFRILEFPTAIL